MYNTFQYVIGNEGVDSQISYSYKGRVISEKIKISKHC